MAAVAAVSLVLGHGHIWAMTRTGYFSEISKILFPFRVDFI